MPLKYGCTLVTGCVVVTLVLCHLVRSLFSSWGYGGFCLMLGQVISYQEWYRILTHCAVHQGYLHLFAVAAFLLVVGTLVERRLGSLHFANILILFTVLVPLFHLLIEVLLVYFFNDLMYRCYVGFSSVVFGIFVLEVCSAKQRWESLIGYLSLSWWIVPWLSVLVCEVITRSHVALLGHIAGLVVGHMYTMDLLVLLKITGNKIVMLEKAELMRSVVKLPGFVCYPTSELLPLSGYQKSSASASGSKSRVAKKGSEDLASSPRGNPQTLGQPPGSPSPLSLQTHLPGVSPGVTQTVKSDPKGPSSLKASSLSSSSSSSAAVASTSSPPSSSPSSSDPVTSASRPSEPKSL